MSGNSVHREKFHRRELRDDDKYESNYRDRNRDRHEDRHRNERRDKSPKRRERSRSRSNTRDEDGRLNRQPKQNFRNQNRRNRDNYSRKFEFDGKNTKREASPEWGKAKVKDEEKKNPQDKDKPNFGLSGKLTEDTNTVNGIVIKYSEPQDSRKPKRRWRLYPFKGEKALATLYVHRQSAYLMGRDRKVADIPLDHPSCSKQHAALQYRLVPFKRENGGEGKRVRPYIIDLESANGTFVNNVKLEPRRYHELLERDVIKFGFSSREYVLLHEHSRDDELDDDVTIPNET